MQPGEDIASDLNRNSIRNDHREEARQQGEDIASYLNKNSIRNDNRRR